MKNFFKSFILLFIVFFTVSVKAQIGVRLAANLANISVSPDDGLSHSSKIGFGAGLFYRIQAGNLTIQPELNFVQQGAKSEFSLLGTNVTSSITMNYLQVPILVKYGFGDMDAVNYFVQAGPYLGLGMGKVKSETCAGSDCETSEINYGSGDEDVKGLDFGLQLGAGVNITSNISVDARYVLGLSNFQNNPTGDASSKHNAINVGVGYKF